MVTLQILVLPFLVRVRIPQQRKTEILLNLGFSFSTPTPYSIPNQGTHITTDTSIRHFTI